MPLSQQSTNEMIWWLVSLGLIILLCLVVVPRLQVRRLKHFLEPGELFDRENEARKTVAQMVGGLALLGTIYGALQTQRAANETQRIANEQLELTRDAQLSERFTKATEQLANKDLMSRIGGLLSLEKAAITDPKRYHWTAVEVLTEFVRRGSAIPAEPFKCPPDFPGPPKDLYIALRVLGRRDASKDPSDRSQNRLYLAELNLCRAYLSRLDLAFAEFERSHLERALFRESNLAHAWLENAYLAGAFFQGADLSDATLVAADLTDAEMPKAVFKNADLESASLKNTCLDDADLSQVRNLTQQQLDVALGNEKTRLPPGVTRPANWTKGGRDSCVVE